MCVLLGISWFIRVKNGNNMYDGPSAPWLVTGKLLKSKEQCTQYGHGFKDNYINDKLQYVICGFDTRGTVTEINPQTGEQKQRPIKPKESVWYQYEKIFTDDYKLVSEDYKKFLLSFENKEYEGVENEPYRRVWTKPITSYASNYNLFVNLWLKSF